MWNYQGEVKELYKGFYTLAEKIARLEHDDPEEFTKIKVLMLNHLSDENYHDEKYMVIGERLFKFLKYKKTYNNNGGYFEGNKEGNLEFDYQLDGDFADYFAEELVAAEGRRK